jgi:tRNA A37 threonylcarbamoyladenosine dehydratase
MIPAVHPMFQRFTLLAGAEASAALSRARVMIFGLGGVGSWCAEALVRSGIADIVLVDSDRVCISNINRQVQATAHTVGQYKTDALRTRLLQINPDCAVSVFSRIFSRESAELFGIEGADYVIDAIDSLSCKLDLIEYVFRAGIPFFSSMGMAQKLDPTRLKTACIWETRGCPLARLVRQGLRKRGFRDSFTVVYSDERLPLRGDVESPCGTARCFCPKGGTEWCSSKKIINGSAVTVTAAAGMILASLILTDIYSRYAGRYGTAEYRGAAEDAAAGEA